MPLHPSPPPAPSPTAAAPPSQSSPANAPLPTSHSTILLENITLLSGGPSSFATRYNTPLSAATFARPGAHAAANAVLHFLLVALDGAPAAAAFAHCYPPLDRAQERDFRSAVNSRLVALERAKLLPVGSTRRSVTAAAGGERFQMLLACLSTVALKKLSARHPAHAMTHSLVAPVRNAFNASPGSYAKQLRTRIAAERVVFARTTQVGKGSAVRFTSEVHALEERVAKYARHAEVLRAALAAADAGREEHGTAAADGDGSGAGDVKARSVSGASSDGRLTGGSSRSASDSVAEVADVDIARREEADRAAVLDLLAKFSEFANVRPPSQLGESSGAGRAVLEGPAGIDGGPPVDIIQVIAQATAEIKAATSSLRRGDVVPPADPPVKDVGGGLDGGGGGSASGGSDSMTPAAVAAVAVGATGAGAGRDAAEDAGGAGGTGAASVGAGDGDGSGSGSGPGGAVVSDISCESVESIESPASAPAARRRQQRRGPRENMDERERRAELCSDQDVDVDILEEDDEVEEGDAARGGGVPGQNRSGAPNPSQPTAASAGNSASTGSGGSGGDSAFVDAGAIGPDQFTEGASPTAETPSHDDEVDDDMYADSAQVLASLERHRALLDASVELTAEATATATFARVESRGLLESPVSPDGADKTGPATVVPVGVGGDEGAIGGDELDADAEADAEVAAAFTVPRCVSPRPENRRQLLGVRPSTPPPKWTATEIDIDEEDEVEYDEKGGGNIDGGSEGDGNSVRSGSGADVQGDGSNVEKTPMPSVGPSGEPSVTAALLREGGKPAPNDSANDEVPLSPKGKAPVAGMNASSPKLQSRIAFFNTLNTLREGAAIARPHPVSPKRPSHQPTSSRRLLGAVEPAPLPAGSHPLAHAAATPGPGFAGAGAANSWVVPLAQSDCSGTTSYLDVRASGVLSPPVGPLVSALASEDEHLKRKGVPRAVRFAQLPTSNSSGSTSSSSSAVAHGDQPTSAPASASEKTRRFSSVQRAGGQVATVNKTGQGLENEADADGGSEVVQEETNEVEQETSGKSGRASSQLPAQKRLERRSTPLRLGRLLVPRSGGSSKSNGHSSSRSEGKGAASIVTALASWSTGRPTENASAGEMASINGQGPVVDHAVPLGEDDDVVAGPRTSSGGGRGPAHTDPATGALPVFGFGGALTSASNSTSTQGISHGTVEVGRPSAPGGPAGAGHRLGDGSAVSATNAAPPAVSTLESAWGDETVTRPSASTRGSADKLETRSESSHDPQIREVKRSEWRSVASKSGSILQEAGAFPRRLFATPESTTASGGGHRRSKSIGSSAEDVFRSPGFRSSGRARSELNDARVVSFSSHNGDKPTMVLCSSGDGSDEEHELSGLRVGASARSNSDFTADYSPSSLRNTGARFGAGVKTSERASSQNRDSRAGMSRSGRLFSLSPSPSKHNQQPRERQTSRDSSSSRPSAGKKASSRIKSLRDRFLKLS